MPSDIVLRPKLYISGNLYSTNRTFKNIATRERKSIKSIKYTFKKKNYQLNSQKNRYPVLTELEEMADTTWCACLTIDGGTLVKTILGIFFMGILGSMVLLPHHL
jgi:hypothetical protein